MEGTVDTLETRLFLVCSPLELFFGAFVVSFGTRESSRTPANTGEQFINK